MSWKQIMLIVAALAGALAVGYAIRVGEDQRAAAVTTIHVDSLVGAWQHFAAAGNMLAGIDTAGATAQAVRADSMVARTGPSRKQATRDSIVADSLLAVAQRTRDDSLAQLRQLVPVLQSEVGSLRQVVADLDSAHAADTAALHRQIDATHVLAKITADDAALIRVLRDSTIKLGRLTAPQTFGQRYGTAIETGAIAVIVVDYCREHALSVGCLIGVVEAGQRFVRRH